MLSYLHKNLIRLFCYLLIVSSCAFFGGWACSGSTGGGGSTATSIPLATPLGPQGAASPGTISAPSDASSTEMPDIVSLEKEFRLSYGAGFTSPLDPKASEATPLPVSEGKTTLKFKVEQAAYHISPETKGLVFAFWVSDLKELQVHMDLAAPSGSTLSPQSQDKTLNGVLSKDGENVIFEITNLSDYVGGTLSLNLYDSAGNKYFLGAFKIVLSS